MKKITLAFAAVAVALLAITAPASAASCGGKPWTAEAFVSGECFRASATRFAGDGTHESAPGKTEKGENGRSAEKGASKSDNGRAGSGGGSSAGANGRAS